MATFTFNNCISLFCSRCKFLRLLLSNGISQVSVSGDTRYDRLVDNVESFEEFPIIKAFKHGRPLIVCGSTYLKDSLMLIKISQRNPNLKFIIAPHEIDICRKLKRDIIKLSQANNETIKSHSVNNR